LIFKFATSATKLVGDFFRLSQRGALLALGGKFVLQMPIVGASICVLAARLLGVCVWKRRLVCGARCVGAHRLAKGEEKRRGKSGAVKHNAA